MEDLIATPSTMLDGNDAYDFAHEQLSENHINPVKQDYSGLYPMVPFHKPPNILAEIGAGKGPTIHLNCHLDTVSPGEGWTSDPFTPRRENGRMYGLGACDMKAGAAILLLIMKMMAQEKEKMCGKVVLSCVSGEEAPYSLGTDALMKMNDLSDTNMVIIPEPSPILAEKDFCTVHKKNHKAEHPVLITGAAGRRIYEIVLYGKSAHASHPEKGINALEEAARVISKLKDFNLFNTIKTGSGHYCVLNIEGGDETFTVPGQCRFLVTRHFVMGEKERDIKKEIKAVITNSKLKSRICVRKRFTPLPELEYDPYISEGAKEMEKFIAFVEKRHGEKQCRFVSKSVGDFNYFGSRLKKPTMVFGPGGGNIHAPNEFVSIKEAMSTLETLYFYLKERMFR
ncbi:MAG: M20/M25/M40 family metallo-hydrolase [Candidatus Thermoplasmatota archaeon]|nr:M20/M25/M40 family metallo-hydrolase [Candidatus Thermoplasmatota archaeon]